MNWTYQLQGRGYQPSPRWRHTLCWPCEGWFTSAKGPLHLKMNIHRSGLHSHLLPCKNNSAGILVWAQTQSCLQGIHFLSPCVILRLISGCSWTRLVFQTGLKLTSVLSPQAPKCWYYGLMPQCPSLDLFSRVAHDQADPGYVFATTVLHPWNPFPHLLIRHLLIGVRNLRCSLREQ